MPKKKLVKKKGNWKRAIAISASALTASGVLWYLVNTQGVKLPVPAYRAMRVIDGDTFETEERQLIRLTGIDAPELEYCNGPESKQALEKLILNQNLYVKVVYHDNHQRLISHVYNDNGLVSEQMVKTGMAYYTASGLQDPALVQAGKYAREKKLGIFSPKCTQETNPDSSTCVIKGNIRLRSNGNKIYHFPGCGQYDDTLVELYKGDKWFCTEAQAKKEGFAKGADCFAKTWN